MGMHRHTSADAGMPDRTMQAHYALPKNAQNACIVYDSVNERYLLFPKDWRI